jgi:hypothetical protein
MTRESTDSGVREEVKVKALAGHHSVRRVVFGIRTEKFDLILT